MVQNGCSLRVRDMEKVSDEVATSHPMQRKAAGD